jgi:hypothetical protein
MKKLLIIIVSALALTHATAADTKATPPLQISSLAGSPDFPAITSVGNRLIATFEIQAGATDGKFGERLAKFLSHNPKILIEGEGSGLVETTLGHVFKID